MSNILVRARARRDILVSADYLEGEGGAELAIRFIEATQATFTTLAMTPKMGALCGFRSPITRRLRRWQVNGFENWLIFYLPRIDEVEIIHVLHGARDIETLLDDEDADE